MNVGSNIKKRRESLGITQEALAEQACITQSMLCQIERGTKNPSLQVGLTLAELLHCTVNDLCEFEAKPM